MRHGVQQRRVGEGGSVGGILVGGGGPRVGLVGGVGGLFGWLGEGFWYQWVSPDCYWPTPWRPMVDPPSLQLR